MSHATALAAHDENERVVAVVAQETRSSHVSLPVGSVAGGVGGVGGVGLVAVTNDATVHPLVERTASFTALAVVVSLGMRRTFAALPSADGTTTNSASSVVP